MKLSRAVGALLALAMTVTTLASASAVASGPASQTVVRATEPAVPDLAGFPAKCDRGVTRACRITFYADRPFLVLWGDSHALQYRVPVEQLARSRRLNLVVIFKGGCPLSLPLPASTGEPRAFCDEHNVAALAHVRRLQATGRGVRLILSSWWHFYRVRYAAIQREQRTGESAGLSPYARHIATLGAAGSKAMFAAIGRSRIPADVIAQSGTVPAQAPRCGDGGDPYTCDLPRPQVLPNAASNSRWLRERTAELAGRPRTIDTSSAYCDAVTCYGQVWGHNTFFDRSHLGLGLTTRMRGFFAPTVDALASRR